MIYSRKLWLAVPVGVVLVSSLLLAVVPERVAHNALFPHGVRLVRDDYDRSIYYARAAWFPEHKVPYKEVFSEYPQLATYFFALPLLVARGLYSYMLAFSVLAGLAYILLCYVTLRLLDLLRMPRQSLILLFLPSFLYFTFNRYDIFPALFVSLSFWMLLKGRVKSSWLALAIAVLFKWYALVLVPVYLVYLHKKRKLRLGALAWFAAPIVAVCAYTVATAGWGGLMSPYLWHLARTQNYDSLLFLLQNWFHLPQSGLVLTAFFFLQALSLFVPPLMLWKTAGASAQQLARWATIAILLFIIFAKFYSPQWVIWFYPLLCLVIDGRLLFLVLAMDIANYAEYPVGYALWEGGRFGWYVLITALRTALMLVLVYKLFSEKGTFLRDDLSHSNV